MPVTLRRLLVAAALVGGAAGAAAAVVLVPARPQPPAAGPPVAAAATLLPRTHLFGDRVVAQVRLSLDRRLVDPARVEAIATFRPYRTVKTERLLDGSGRKARLRYLFTLECLSAQCLVGSGRVFRFPDAIVRYRLRDGAGQQAVALRWPSLSVASRVGRDDVARPQFRADLAAPAPSFAVDPDLLGWSLTAGAALLVLAAGASVARRLRARPSEPAPTGVLPPEPSPLERALALAERDAAGPEELRRVALDNLALALEDAQLPSLAREARRLAWSPPAPNRSDIRALVVGGRRSAEVA